MRFCLTLNNLIYNRSLIITWPFHPPQLWYITSHTNVFCITSQNKKELSVYMVIPSTICHHMVFHLPIECMVLIMISEQSSTHRTLVPSSVLEFCQVQNFPQTLGIHVDDMAKACLLTIISLHREPL